MDEADPRQATLDDVDRGILFALQRDARHATHKEIATEVDVAASTVRNRIAKLEAAGVIEGYTPQINYERAGFPLRAQFICSVPVKDRNSLAEEVLEVGGVVSIREMLTSERNLVIEVIATDTKDLTAITNGLTERGLTIHSSELVTNAYNQPFIYFEYQDGTVDTEDSIQ